MRLDIELDRIPFLDVLENFTAITNVAFREYVRDVAKQARANIDPSKSGLHNRSGNLRDSIKVSSYVQYSPSSGGSATVSAGNSRVSYAGTHEFGALIKPVKGKYLTFQIAGQWIRTKQVNIPARPYLNPAGEELKGRFDEYMDRALERILGRI